MTPKLNNGIFIRDTNFDLKESKELVPEKFRDFIFGVNSDDFHVGVTLWLQEEAKEKVLEILKKIWTLDTIYYNYDWDEDQQTIIRSDNSLANLWSMKKMTSMPLYVMDPTKTLKLVQKNPMNEPANVGYDEGRFQFSIPAARG